MIKKYIENIRIRWEIDLISIVMSNKKRQKKISCIMKECMKRFKCRQVSVFNCDDIGNRVKLFFTSNGDRNTLLKLQEYIFAIMKGNHCHDKCPVILGKIVFQPIIINGEITMYIVLEDVLNPEKLISTSDYADNAEKVSIAIGVLWLQEQLRRSWKTDPLTMLANEIQLREDLEKCRTMENCMFGIVKIEELDIINKNCSVKIGNYVICEISRILQVYVEKKRGAIYRFVGNMFGLILFGDYRKNYYGLLDFCTLIRDMEIETPDGVVQVHVSVGIVEMKNCSDIVKIDDIYKNAISAASADDGGVTFYGDRKEKENNTENTVIIETIIKPGENSLGKFKGKIKKIVDGQEHIPRILGDSGFDYFSLFDSCGSGEKEVWEKN